MFVRISIFTWFALAAAIPAEHSFVIGDPNGLWSGGQEYDGTTGIAASTKYVCMYLGRGPFLLQPCEGCSSSVDQNCWYAVRYETMASNCPAVINCVSTTCLHYRDREQLGEEPLRIRGNGSIKEGSATSEGSGCAGVGCPQPGCAGADCPHPGCAGADCPPPGCAGADCPQPGCAGADCPQPGCAGTGCPQPGRAGADCPHPGCAGGSAN